MEVKSRGARWSVILGSVVAGLAVWALPRVAVAGESVSSAVSTRSQNTQAQFTARYRAALGDLWNGKPLEAIDPLYQLVLDGGCDKHKCQLRLAQAYRNIGELEEARRWAEAAVDRAAKVGVSGSEEYNELGLCLFELAKRDPVYLDQAVVALRESVDRHTQRGDTYLYNLAQVLLAAGEAEEAGTILEKFQESRGLRPIIEKGEAVIGDFNRLEVVDRHYAKYTLEAKRQGIEGQILLRAVIDAEGNVADAEVVQGLPNGLNEAALKALRRSKFQPATLNGEPVAAVYHQSLDMKLTAALVSQHRISGDSHGH